MKEVEERKYEKTANEKADVQYRIFKFVISV